MPSATARGTLFEVLSSRDHYRMTAASVVIRRSFDNVRWQTAAFVSIRQRGLVAAPFRVSEQGGAGVSIHPTSGIAIAFAHSVPCVGAATLVLDYQLWRFGVPTTLKPKPVAEMWGWTWKG